MGSRKKTEMMVRAKLSEGLRERFSTRGDFHHRGHLVMSGDHFDYHNCGVQRWVACGSEGAS